MGATSPKPVRLGPPLSLRALGLTPESTLGEALNALIRTRDEIQGPQQSNSAAKNDEDQLRQRRGASPEKSTSSSSSNCAKDQFYVLLDRGSDKEPEVLGKDVAVENAEYRLHELGVVEDNDDSEEDDASRSTPPLRLCLAGVAPKAIARKPSQPCRGLCSRRACVRRTRRCCRCSSSRLWRILPERCKGWLQPVLQQCSFYLFWIRLGLTFLWQDRHEMLAEFKSALYVDLCTPDTLPPCRSQQIVDELCPFSCALVVGLLYAVWSLSWQVALAPQPPMNLTLS